METMLLWTLLGFFTGGIPFSVLVGRIFLKTDIRRYGDGNPGGINAWKAGGLRAGLLAGLLDYLKGVLPVMAARVSGGVDGWTLVPVALAPVFGHAFSPFLKFRGGKAIASSLGIWVGLRGIEAPLVFAIPTLIALALQVEHAWTVIVGMAGLFVYYYTIGGPAYLMAVAAVNLLVFLYKHRVELRRPIQFRPWATNLFLRRGF